MRNQNLPILSVIVIILSAAFAFPAHAIVYAPGVSPGNYVTFTHFDYAANATLPPNFGSLNGTSSLTNTVTNVVANNVTIRQNWTFNNGTLPKSNTLSGLVDTGAGNLTFFVLAGGLTAGDPVYTTPQGQNFFQTVNQTVTRYYAGAIRSVNVINYTLTFQPYFIKATIYNDALTGFLLEFSESAHFPNSPTSSVTFSFHALATSTNVWPASASPDFSFDAIPASSTRIIPGQSLAFNLNLTSFRSYTGLVTISAGLVASNSSVTNHLTVSPASSSLTIPPSKSAQATITASSTSTTTLGLYILSVNATDGTIHHSDHLTVRVVTATPPDFTISPSPASLSIPQGTAGISTITLTSQGGLYGSVGIFAYSSDPANLSISPTSTSVPLPAGGTSQFDITVSAASSAPAKQYTVTVTAYIGTTYHTATILPTVTANVAGDFSIAANPAALIIPQGHAKYTNVTLTSLNGFSGMVSIGYYRGVPGALYNATSTATLFSGGAQTFKVEIYVPLSTVPGNYYLNVSGTAQTTHTIKIPVQVISSSLLTFRRTLARVVLWYPLEPLSTRP